MVTRIPGISSYPVQVMRRLRPLLVLLAVLLLPTARAEEATTERERTDLRWLVRTLRFALERARAGTEATGDVGVYLGQGVFPPSGLAAVRRLDEAGLEPRLLFASDVDKAGLKGLRLLVMPGGWAPSQLAGLGAGGQEALVAFVERGGRYLGICAGGYLPCTEIEWEGQVLPYPVGLVRGRASGPVPGRVPYPRAEVFRLELEGGGREPALYAGGSSFEVEGATILARYPGGKPAVIEVKKGRGRLILTGAHVEFSTRKDRDLLDEEAWARGLKPGDANLFETFRKRLE